jgi:hypothetical protein
VPIRRAAQSPLAACVALATLLALSGCGLADRAGGARGADAEPTPTAERSTQPPGRPQTTAGGRPEQRTSTVTLGDVVLQIVTLKAADVRADEDGPDTRTVTLTLAAGRSARLALASPGALDVDTDGSITVLDGDGDPVAAIGPPAPPSGTEDGAPRIGVTDIDATHALVEVGPIEAPQGSESPAPTDRAELLPVTFVVGTQAIESATWGENEGGRSLAVDPTDWARYAGQAGLDLIRTQLVAAEPEADTSTMGDQLVCHAVGAPDKSTWNLEPWRPDVGLILTATAQCNPV